MLNVTGRLIVGNTVLFQISVESPAMRYQGQAKQGFAYHLHLFLNFPRAAILDYMTIFCFPTIVAAT